MNKKPIGIFDSGVGGLTVVREIIKLLPDESIIYLGDTANLPYGEKSEDIIRQYAIDNTRFLLKFGIKILVVACNTASSVALDLLKNKFNIPIIGVIEPAVRGAIEVTHNRKIGVIGTNRTIKSGIYAATLKGMDNSLSIFSKPCPLLVPLIEENFIDHEATRLITLEYLKELEERGIDTMILGCTHYPLIYPIISNLLPEVRLIDSALSTAHALKSTLESMGLECPEGSTAGYRFFATDISEKLNILAKSILKNILPEKENIFEKIAL
jgi:glutamate racemase